MSETQNVLLIVTTLMSIMGFGLGISNLLVNRANQRMTLRQKVFDKQIDFFIVLNEFTANIEFELDEYLVEVELQEEIVENLILLMDELFLHVDSNEIIIPDTLYSSITNYVIKTNQIVLSTSKDSAFLNEKIVDEMVEVQMDLLIDISEFLGLEKLSKENMLLVRKSKVT